ncbi:MAG: large subunit ribosomal protein L15 [Candidatus Saccharimonadales bacterium]|jgi:large subunit ribosomal protein L15
MKFNELKTTRAKKRIRAGRGIAAGRGKTAGRGTKGQRARAGNGKKPGFEGGQNPLYKRIPKLRGFTPFWDKPTTVTTLQLSQFKGVVDNFTLYEARILADPSDIARVVVRGDLTTKVDVRLQSASEKAIDIITKAGGSFQKTHRVKAVGKSEDK